MRSIWKGAISFGLVTIPVALFSATEDRTPKFKMLRKTDGSPIKYKRVAESDGTEVTWERRPAAKAGRLRSQPELRSG